MELTLLQLLIRMEVRQKWWLKTVKMVNHQKFLLKIMVMVVIQSQSSILMELWQKQLLKMAKMVEMDVMVETAKMENVDAKTNQ